MASKKLTYEALREEYAALWTSMEPRASKAADVEATAKKIIAKKTRYSAVQEVTGVPWFMVGIIHAMEAGCNFGCHLHNGDPLTDRTVQVPAGRPKIGVAPFSWKDSAVDALTMHDLDKVGEWPIERICYELERYNGFGYRNYHSDVLSPYLWSGTNHYSRGKYVADGKWSASAVSGQSGSIAILKRIMELDATVAPSLETQEPAQSVEEVVATPAEAFPRAKPPSPVAAAVRGRTFRGILLTILGGIAYVFREAVEIFTAAAVQFEALAPVAKVLTALGFGVAIVSIITALAGLGLAGFARIDDAQKGRTA